MSMNDYNHINARAIEFLFPNIYDIKDTDQYEEKYIKKIAIDHLKELISIKDETSTNENKKFIEQRFPLYLHLCGKDIEVIKEFPEVYANRGSIVKKIFDNYMKFNTTYFMTGAYNLDEIWTPENLHRLSFVRKGCEHLPRRCKN